MEGWQGMDSTSHTYVFKTYGFPIIYFLLFAISVETISETNINIVINCYQY